jgi:Cu(I)/Ag(I) efflux system membrane fusion protein
MTRYRNPPPSPLRRLENAVLWAVYALIQGMVGARDTAGALRRRVLVFTTLALSAIAIVMVAAIPVTHYLLGDNFKVVAAVDEKAPLKGEISGRGQDASPFAALGSLDNGAGAARSVADATPQQSAAPVKETALEHAAKHADPTYVCPMHPQITSKEPGTCPICGMDLVVVDASSGESGTVQVSPAMLSQLGVRTEPAARRNIYRRIDTVGYISEDEDKIRNIALRTEGWIERLVVRSVGDAVKRGDLLFEVYSPVLVNAQDEYVQALDLDNKTLISASEDRLRALGVSDRQIAELRQSRKAKQLVSVFAPQNGVVTQIQGREGMMLAPAQPVMTLVDLSTVWLLVDVFERQADWVRVGQMAQATLPFLPNKVWKGKVEYIYPSIDAKTRSLKVRLRFDNEDMALRPNMYADVRVLANPKKGVLTIPREAVIRTGSDQRVIVALGEGKFIPMPVTTGVETDETVEIASGLQEGDEVVVSSQFLIDSEASLKAALMRMQQ